MNLLHLSLSLAANHICPFCCTRRALFCHADAKAPAGSACDADSPVLIWDIDLKLANALPRNFRTTNDPLKENKG